MLPCVRMSKGLLYGRVDCIDIPGLFRLGKVFHLLLTGPSIEGFLDKGIFQDVRGVIFQEWSAELCGEEIHGFIGKGEGICGIGDICTENDFIK